MIDEPCGVFLADNGDYLVAVFDTDEEAEEYIRRVDEDWTPREIPDDGPYYYIDTIERSEVDFDMLNNGFALPVHTVHRLTTKHGRPRKK
jgi:hypothetical protein